MGRSIDDFRYFIALWHYHLPHSLASPPDLQLSDFLHFLFVCLTVVRPAVVFQSPFRLRAVLNAIVKLIEHGFQSILEFLAPVDSSSPCSRGASGIHVVHAILTDQRV